MEKQFLMEIYGKLLLARMYEERMPELIAQGLVIGSMHCCNGQEAVGVGACAALRRDDYITSTHRGHHHYIGKGVDLKRMTAEIFGRVTGLGKGRAGHMLISDHAAGILGGSAIVGGGFTVAVGAGLSIKLKNTDQVVACFFGDGASNTGAFHEAINLAALWKLPVIFICENNQYGLTTHVSHTIPTQDLAVRAQAYGIPGSAVDGNDILEVYESTRKAVLRARNGDGPDFIEAKTYRMVPFSNRDRCGYQPPEEIEQWRAKDPVARFREYLLEHRIIDDEEDIQARQKAEGAIDEAVKWAAASPFPGQENLLEDLYGQSGSDQ